MASKSLSSHPSRHAFLATNKPPYTCVFCGKRVTVLTGQSRVSLAIHHQDEDRKNDDPRNLRPSHLACHTSHHHKGKVVSVETRRKLRESHLGQTPWNKGVANA